MDRMDRRQFLARTGAAAWAAGAVSTFSINAAGANQRIRIGVMGAGGRGTQLAEWFAQRPDVQVVYVADPDKARRDMCVERIKKIAKRKPKSIPDFRKMLDDKRVDAIINATPDHWHVLGSILACQAGKDVYLEKPLSHNMWEGRKLVEAVRKYKRILQVGTQNRSAHYCHAAREFLQSKDFGDIHFMRVMNSKPRNTIGKLPDTDVPEGIDYDMWLGPAPMRPFNMNHFHYNWHWFWAYSGGDIINDGVHQIDITRWMSGQTYPVSVYSTGGLHHFDDDQETPDTHVVNWDFGKMTIVFEQTLWSPYEKKVPMPIREGEGFPNWMFTGTRIEISGTKCFMNLARHGGGWQAYDKDWNVVKEMRGAFSESNADHIENFLDCIRTRKEPNAPVEEGHLSTAWCHYGNIAYRTGRKLFINPATEGFVNDAEADALLKRAYRAPWVVPEQV
ncbi:MAG TPA: Gfo/Idh/MocA family oxidoreductase [Candidatus Hydrogenedentes bacterium]|nr:Gfo/Idh/MocA family oxidoreductase [Candidatus Hydrogenedentota bacterium]HPC16375.1 Gfo/Idh/MocA family oxidoreductase [Candidatus Hydrogenedentota bacterium]HRT20308.1 Gfo/Idh/MocA family oxidoreductase [Candidatus Hydrogenedentota bacterium]HRT65033.1 Gfo/Idh/MocA family oxidoreductase [Candidatus Hydrogenedentota bacterium]